MLSITKKQRQYFVKCNKNVQKYAMQKNIDISNAVNPYGVVSFFDGGRGGKSRKERVHVVRQSISVKVKCKGFVATDLTLVAVVQRRVAKIAKSIGAPRVAKAAAAATIPPSTTTTIPPPTTSKTTTTTTTTPSSSEQKRKLQTSHNVGRNLKKWATSINKHKERTLKKDASLVNRLLMPTSILRQGDDADLFEEKSTTKNLWEFVERYSYHRNLSGVENIALTTQLLQPVQIPSMAELMAEGLRVGERVYKIEALQQRQQEKLNKGLKLGSNNIIEDNNSNNNNNNNNDDVNDDDELANEMRNLYQELETTNRENNNKMFLLKQNLMQKHLPLDSAKRKEEEKARGVINKYQKNQARKQQGGAEVVVQKKKNPVLPW